MAKRDPSLPGILPRAVRNHRRWALVLLLVILMAVYAYGYFSLHLPYRSSGYDTFSHVGLLRLTRSQLGLNDPLDPDLFPALYRGNERLGINYVVLALLASLPGSSDQVALFLAGLLGIAVFFMGLHLLAGELSGSWRVGALAIFLSLALCGYELRPRGNSFSLAEILICAHYASVLALGLTMISLALHVRYLEKGGAKSYLLQVALAFLTFNIHLLTGVEYFILLFILVVTHALVNRRLSSRHLQLLLLIPAVLALASAWPLYHWWSIFGKNPVSLGGRTGKFTSLGSFLEKSVLYVLGLPFLLLVRDWRRVFLLAWALLFALVTMSYALPFSVSYYWRFAVPMRIPLVIGLAWGLGVDIWALRRWKLVTVPVVIVTALAFLGTAAWRTFQRFDFVLSRNAYQEVEAFRDAGEKGECLVAHPAPGYDLMGMSSFQVISVMKGHAPEELIQPRNERLYQAFSLPDPEIWRALLTDFGARKVLVPRRGEYQTLNLLLNGIRVKRNPYYELWEVDPEGLDTAVITHLPDPDLEETEYPYDYLRLRHWADLQLSGTQDTVLQKANDAEGDAYLSLECIAPESSLLLVNRGYLALQPGRPYRLHIRYRCSEGSPAIQPVLLMYSSPSPLQWVGARSLSLDATAGDWREVDLVIGCPGRHNPDLSLLPEASLVKVGLFLFRETTGRIDLDEIDLQLLSP